MRPHRGGRILGDRDSQRASILISDPRADLCARGRVEIALPLRVGEDEAVGPGDVEHDDLRAERPRQLAAVSERRFRRLAGVSGYDNLLEGNHGRFAFVRRLEVSPCLKLPQKCFEDSNPNLCRRNRNKQPMSTFTANC